MVAVAFRWLTAQRRLHHRISKGGAEVSSFGTGHLDGVPLALAIKGPYRHDTFGAQAQGQVGLVIVIGSVARQSN